LNPEGTNKNKNIDRECHLKVQSRFEMGCRLSRAIWVAGLAVKDNSLFSFYSKFANAVDKRQLALLVSAIAPVQRQRLKLWNNAIQGEQASRSKLT
jgi:hypothetical protein